jgi:type III pantothenate kinase
MWLVVDVGNTNTVMGIYEGKRLLHRWRVASDQERTADEHTLLLRQLCSAASLKVDKIDGIVIGSVVPALTKTFAQATKTLFGLSPLEVCAKLNMGLEIGYQDPGQIGADRLANAVAAREKFPGAVIVVDFGTATTFDVISAAGKYLGGVITPGLRTSASDLFARAARLPRFVEITVPKGIIGRNTVESIQAGLFFGTVGQVDEIVNRIQGELGERATVVATGGLAELIAPQSRTIQQVCPTLTLEGLVAIGEKNRKSS